MVSLWPFQHCSKFLRTAVNLQGSHVFMTVLFHPLTVGGAKEQNEKKNNQTLLQ